MASGSRIKGGLGGFWSAAGRDLGAGGVSLSNGSLKFGQNAGFFQAGGVAGERGFVAVEGGEGLQDLSAAAMAVHVAEAANVHEDVET